MPNRRTHCFVGGAAGLAVGLMSDHRSLAESEQVARAIGALIGGVAGGAMPDILEPADNPNHRAFAHSVLVGGGLAALGIKLSGNLRGAARLENVPLVHGLPTNAAGCAMILHFLSGVILGMAVGYASHIVLDALTPKGVPLAVRGF